MSMKNSGKASVPGVYDHGEKLAGELNTDHIMKDI